MRLLAQWRSQGNRWSAILYKVEEGYGYRLSELKHGEEFGAVFRPSSQFANNDNAAIVYFADHVKRIFDVNMIRVEM